ncbi:mCG1051043, partial [Mus musculus]
MTRSAKP